MHYVTHRKLNYLTALGPGNIHDLQDLCRDVARRSVVADLLFYPSHQVFIKPLAITQLHKQYNASVARPFLPDHQRLDNFRQ
ncbi:hypothetical protein D3C80_1223940 [compost metagenome]